MFGAVTAFKAMKSARPEAQARRQAVHREPPRRDEGAADQGEARTMATARRATPRAAPDRNFIALELGPQSDYRDTAMGADEPRDDRRLLSTRPIRQ